MQPHFPLHANRRDFLLKAGGGLGSIAVAHLLSAQQSRAESPAGSPLAPRPSHFAGKARRVIYLFMHGGPSHMDLWDPKPDLVKYSGQPLPESFGSVMTRRNVARNPLLGPIKPFRPRGQSGLEMSDFLPHMAELADEFCVLRSCHGDSVNHPQSVYQMNTGSILGGKPSLGSWVAYGLGTENQNMPAFVVLPDPSGGLKGGPPAWGSGFLPASYQGTTMRPGENPILNLQPPESVTSTRQRRILDAVHRLNQSHLAARDFDDDLAARVRSYELAFRMQTAVPGVIDFSSESEGTKALYGLDEDATRPFGQQLLAARRFVEQGVRFIQIMHGDGAAGAWDQHSGLKAGHSKLAQQVDKPIAGLLKDLKQRGLLDETLIVFATEFGRTPGTQGKDGRDHHPYGFSVWMAGGGVQGGVVHGATDEIGFHAVENPHYVTDVHATLLHQLGLQSDRMWIPDHQRLERDFGHVIHDILA